MEKKLLVVLTGAGISAESGIRTFRDSDGLWEGYAIEEVATPEAWEASPQRVLDFYNQRRRDILAAEPNEAHHGLRRLEEKYEVLIITQNVDDLHERAGSKRVLHLHGEILKMRSERDPALVQETRQDIRLGDRADDGAQLRPHIVWFGEEVPMIGIAAQMAARADLFVVVGTSLMVYPAAGLIDHTRPGIPIYVIDKSIPKQLDKNRCIAIEGPATEGVARLLETLMQDTGR